MHLGPILVAIQPYLIGALLSVGTVITMLVCCSREAHFLPKILVAVGHALFIAVVLPVSISIPATTWIHTTTTVYLILKTFAKVMRDINNGGDKQ